MKSFILILSLGIFTNIFASEVDSFTSRSRILGQRNSLQPINNQINHYVGYVLERFNKRYSCSEKAEKKLYDLTGKLRKCLGGHWRTQCGGTITLYRWLKYAKYGAGIDKLLLHPKNSVYRDFKLLKSPSLTLVSFFHNTMAVALNINGHVIGSDKFSHFFNRGRKYWKNYYGHSKKAKKINRHYGSDKEKARMAREQYALAVGKYSEESLFGAKSTGVASYGDLAANFSGMRFWNNITGLGADIITGEAVEEPYIKCVGNQFVLNKKIDMGKYINAAWDEGQNCSVYQTRKMALQVQRRVSALPEGESLHCPISKETLESAESYYGRFYPEVVKARPYEGLAKGIKRPKHYHFYDL